MHTQDYYTVLGISKDASSDTVRKAYKNAARKFHPDINKDVGAEDRFKEVGEAYEVLKDNEKRKLYDKYGKNWQEAERTAPEREYGGFTDRSYEGGSGFHYSSGGSPGNSDLDDILKNLFGGAAQFDGQQRTTGWQQSAAGFNGSLTEYELRVSLEDIHRGAVKHISLQEWEEDGQGGLEKATKELKVTIPKGVTDGSVIRLGGAGNSGAVDGKLHIRLKIVPHKRFTVDGYNLRTVIAVSPWEAILGAKIPVETMDGKVNLSVPQSSQNGNQLRLRGKGLAKKGREAGDIIVSLEVRLPEGMNSEEEQLLRSIAEKLKFDPRKSCHQRPKSELV